MANRKVVPESDSAAQVEERFNCAVEVIQSLPKKGSFQPSNEMMLRFYSLYKQANNGPCQGPRPSFWDPVGRAKYDSWSSLGDMPRFEAMDSYVEELKKIVEVMPQTEAVGNFTRTLGRFYELVDVEKPVPLERATKGKTVRTSDRSPTRTPLPLEHSVVRCSSPATKSNSENGFLPSGTSLNRSSISSADEGHEVNDDDDTDQFADTVDVPPDMTFSGSGTEASILPINGETVSTIMPVLERIQLEIINLGSRLSNMEKSLADLVAVSQAPTTKQNVEHKPKGSQMLTIFKTFRISHRTRSLILFLIPIIVGYLLFRRRFALFTRR